MSSDWYSAGIDPQVLPEGLRAVLDHWRAAADDRANPFAGDVGLLSLPDRLLDRVAIVEMANPPGSGQGRFRLAGSAVIDFYGADIAHAPLRELVAESREDLVEDVAQLFVDEDTRLPVFLQVDRPDRRPDIRLSALILPLRRRPDGPRLLLVAYDFAPA